MLHYIAIISMLLDHVGLVFFSDSAAWRVIGRLALPIYVFCCALGIQHTRNVKQYCYRLLVIAIFSQIPYMLIIDPFKLNIVFNLLLSVLVIVLLNRQNKLNSFYSFFVVTIGVLLSLMMDYSFYCLLLMLAYFYIRNIYVLFSYHFVLNLIVMVAFEWYLQILSIIATVILLYRNRLPELKMNTFLYRSFYPLHLVILSILFYFIK